MVRIALANGLSVTIYSPGYLRNRLTQVDGDPAIQIDENRALWVVTDIRDASITDKGDGRFHPFRTEYVVHAVQALQHQQLNMSVSIYLLPFPRRGGWSSATVGTEIFLGPHVQPVDQATTSYIVAHEIGHAFHNTFLSEDDESEEWAAYRHLRGIVDPLKFSASSPPAYRPKEIFAEDFRVLFGGPDAYFGGCVENPELQNPQLIASLGTYFIDVAARSEPRPFHRAS